MVQESVVNYMLYKVPEIDFQMVSAMLQTFTVSGTKGSWGVKTCMIWAIV